MSEAVKVAAEMAEREGRYRDAYVIIKMFGVQIIQGFITLMYWKIQLKTAPEESIAPIFVASKQGLDTSV